MEFLEENYLNRRPVGEIIIFHNFTINEQEEGELKGSDFI